VHEPEKTSQVAQAEGKAGRNDTRKHRLFSTFFAFVSEMLILPFSKLVFTLQQSGFSITAKTALSTV
jgi:hypothetical protein